MRESAAVNDTDDEALGSILGELRDDSSMDLSLDRSVDCLRDPAGLGKAEIGEPGETPLVKLLSAMIAEAIHAGATAVELVPAADRATVMLVIGDAKRERDRLPLSLYGPLAALIKRLSGLDVSELHNARAGAMGATVDDRNMTLPVRITPTLHGESIRIDLPEAQPGVFATIKRKLHTPRVRLLQPDADSLLMLLAAQSAEGSIDFLSTDIAIRAVSVRGALESLVGARPDAGATIDAVMPTTMCLLSLQTTHAARRDLWNRAHTKGVRYVATTLNVDAGAITAALDGLSQASAGATA